ncbi:MAG: hypothetical protein R3195_13255 [Gemmatimonadota bacterium]|nr:hypothetical protein [Gemmatimonadota bacterium]
MSVDRLRFTALIALFCVLVVGACTTELDRTRVQTFGKPAPTSSWGDVVWGPSREPLPSSFEPIEPVPEESGWERVSEWAGDGTRKTELFSVDAEWQIVWRSGAREGDRPLQIKAFAIPGDVLVANVSQDGETQVSALHLRGGGTFYLEVDGSGGPWHVAIEVPRNVTR